MGLQETSHQKDNKRYCTEIGLMYYTLHLQSHSVRSYDLHQYCKAALGRLP